REVLGLARDFIEFGGRRAAAAILLMILAGLLESASLALLAPLFAIFTNPGRDSAATKLFNFLLPPDATMSTKLALVLMLFVIVMAIRSVVMMARDRTNGLLQLEFGERLQVRLMEALGAARWQDIENLKHARIQQALGGSMGRVMSGTQLMLQGAVQFTMLLAQWFMVLLLAPAVAVIFLVIAAIGAFPLVRALKGSSALGREMSSGGLTLVHTTSQLLGGLKLSFAQNMQPAFVKEYARVARELKDRRFAYQRGQSSMRAALTVGAAIAGAILLWVGYALGVSIARLLASFAIFARMNTAAVLLIQCSHQLANNAPAHGEIMGLLDDLESGRLVLSKGPQPSLGRMKTLEFDSVTVGKGPDKRLDQVSVVLRRGETIGIAGPSGAGKTTFLDTVAGLVVPDDGVVRINQLPMDRPVANLWRDRISYVTQECFLFNESIRRNLVWGRKEISDDLLWEALSIVRMDGVIGRTGEGLDVEVSERGIRFSGGERQRIALARAILRDPQILILDEATNAIDIETEAAIFARLTSVRPELTIIVVAHRPSTLAMCDRIIRLEDGRLVEDLRIEAPEAVAR
ncbi:MAG TPA: ABC transporter ATP-binding protein, partial [Sphingomicrobium sp.]|nr:ABC transporter ATP-binding protein [Sphingomicrobium sp.]